jgi:hypothetical protein
VAELMNARRKKGAALRAKDQIGIETARAVIDAAKRKLGERGNVWWTDGASDWNRHLVRSTPYAEWFKGIETNKERIKRPDREKSERLRSSYPAIAY